MFKELGLCKSQHRTAAHSEGWKQSAPGSPSAWLLVLLPVLVLLLLLPVLVLLVLQLSIAPSCWADAAQCWGNSQLLVLEQPQCKRMRAHACIAGGNVSFMVEASWSWSPLLFDSSLRGERRCIKTSVLQTGCSPGRGRSCFVSLGLSCFFLSRAASLRKAKLKPNLTSW